MLQIYRWLRKSTISESTWIVACAFTVYFCMYAFRKPFAVAEYINGGDAFSSAISLKSAFIVSQLVGYTTSKYLGVWLCAGVLRRYRTAALVGAILIAELALFGFAVSSPPLKIVSIFVNGLPLGMVWGLVVSFLEGRRTSEFLLAGLSCSFIFADGAVKDVGRLLLRWGVSEYWMPFSTGLLFLLPFIVAVLLLSRTPEPDQKDQLERSPRTPMTIRGSLQFFWRFLPGLAALFVSYIMLTALRDFRDLFGVEVYRSYGYSSEPTLFTRTALAVGIVVLVVLSFLSLIRNHRIALRACFSLMLFGSVTLSVAAWLATSGWISGMTWMILTGVGSYLAYVPFGSILFDRILAKTRFAGNAVFAIYLMDAGGYTASLASYLCKDLLYSNLEHHSFLIVLAYATSWVSFAGLIFAQYYFLRTPVSEDISIETANL